MLIATSPTSPNHAGNWRPTSWRHIAGNRAIVAYWQDMIRGVRNEGVRTGFDSLIIGESGSGKTITTEWGMQCLGCLDLNFETLDACGKCENCTQEIHLWGHQGWESYVDWLDADQVKTLIRYNHIKVDCTRIEPAQLDDILNNLSGGEEYRKFITLDEIHCLTRKGMDEKLLVAMQAHPAVWIAMSACIDQRQKGRKTFEKMLINRFTYILPTEPPENEELMMWSGERCLDCGINVEEPAATLEALAVKCNGVVRRALQLLRRAQNSRDKTLTRKMVDDHLFLD